MNGRKLLLAALCSGFLAAVACGGPGSTTSDGPGGGDPAGTPIGSSGGSLRSSDGKLELTVPAGALDREVRIEIEPLADALDGHVGAAYEIGPSGTEFAVPARLTFTFDAAALAGASPERLRVATVVDGAWAALDGALVDVEAGTVSGVTPHLSPFGVIVVPCADDADCPAGTACVNGSCAANQCEAAEICDNRVDDDCNGAVDDGCGCQSTCASDADCAPGDLCVADPAGCTSCQPSAPPCASDADCARGELCQNGACVPGGGGCGFLAACNGACVDLTSDPANCGSCGNACGPAAPSCVRGACQGNAGCDPLETCDDGLDNDCNGVVDNGCTPPCTTDEDCAPGDFCMADGACYLGCTRGDACGNGLDDNCDGIVDNGC